MSEFTCSVSIEVNVYASQLVQVWWVWWQAL